MLTCSRRSLPVLLQVSEAPCLCPKRAPSIRGNTCRSRAKLATRTRATNAGRELTLSVLLLFIVLFRCHVRLCWMNLMYLLYCSVMIFVTYFVPSDDHLAHNVTAVPAHTFVNTPIRLWITTWPWTNAVTKRSVIIRLHIGIIVAFPREFCTVTLKFFVI